MGELIRFGTVGAATAGLYVLLLWLFRSLDLPLPLAAAAAYALGVTFNYGLQRIWTFRSEVPHRRALPRFLFVHGAGLALNSATLAVLTGALPLWASQSVAVALIAVWSYGAQKLWVFFLAEPEEGRP